MERAKTEVEKKVSKLIKFIQNKNKIPKDSKREILALVTDLQEQCHSLYSSFDDLQQDLDPKSGAKGKSSTDLEYYSSEDIEDVVEEGDEIAELKNKLEVLRNEAEEKERELSLRVKELERELGDAKAECERKGDLEEEIAMKASESKQLGEKNKGLRSQISGLELVLREKGDEISNLVNKFGNSELGLSSRIEELKSQLRNLEQEISFLRARNAELVEGKKVEEKDYVRGLMDQVNNMRHEIVSLRNEKEEFESKLEKKVEEVTETKMQLKSVEKETEEQREQLNEEIGHLREENQKLHTRIAELDSLHKDLETKNIEQIEDDNKKKLVKEQDDIIHRLSEKINDQQRLIKEQKETIDKYSEDTKQMKRGSSGSSRETKLNPYSLERKMEELAENFRKNIEDHIRILYRRIHVAEQIHVESKSHYMKARDAAREINENRESLIFFESHFKKIKEVWEIGYKRSMKKLEEAEEHTDRVATLAREIDQAKIWVCEKNSELETLTAKLECSEAQESLLKEKLSKLEKKLSEEGTEKLTLAKVLSRFETKVGELESKVKGRERDLLSLGEEKREAIRQLCIIVDYQRDRYEELKKSFLEVSLKT